MPTPSITATQYFKAGAATPAFTFGEWSNQSKYTCDVTTYMIYSDQATTTLSTDFENASNIYSSLDSW